MKKFELFLLSKHKLLLLYFRKIIKIVRLSLFYILSIFVKRKKRKFFYIFENILFSIVIIFVINYLNINKILTDFESKSYDYLSKFNIFKYDLLKSSFDNKYLFIDIDDLTYENWGDPLIIPRDRVIYIIKKLLRFNPKLIIIDISIEKNNIDNLKNDNDIAVYLESLNKTDYPNTLGIILPKSIKYNIYDKKNYFIKNSYLDKAVEKSNFIYWASSMFNIDNDLVVRDYPVFICASCENIKCFLPSFSLISYLLINDKLINNENFYKICDSKNSNKIDNNLYDILKINKNDINDEILYEKINYTISNFEKINLNYDDNNFLQISMNLFYENGLENIKELINDRIIIVGGSNSFNGDVHNTPIGLMPGALIALNAIKSSIEFGFNHSSTNFIKYFYYFTIIVISSFYFIRKKVSQYHKYYYILSFLLLIFISTVIFTNYGILFDFITPFAVSAFVYKTLKIIKQSGAKI